VPPTSRYRPSPRPGKLEAPWYDADHAVRKVGSNGEIRWGGAMIFCSEALIGEPVGVAETEPGDWLVRFAEIDLGVIDRRTKRLRRFTAARPRPSPGKLSAMYPVYSARHVPGWVKGQFAVRSLLTVEMLHKLPAERVEVAFPTGRGIEKSSYTGVLLWALVVQ
jgi:hypothetical protein